METPYQIRSAYRSEWDDAMSLAWKTFLRFEADVYSPEGVRHFQDFITDTTLHRMFIMGAYQMFVALYENRIVGMITLRNSTHISLLFVDERYHRKGIGRALIEYLNNYLLTEVGAAHVTVNASPYGVGFYHKLGFQDLRPEEEKDGIIYTPMKFIL
ncbi:MAG: GNAT family N-acetyltransferase [Clostridiales bacterium]|nr:GNAT family N-acetyltransferase [Clostridiales bacterium]